MAEEADDSAIREGQPPTHFKPTVPNPNPDQALMWVILLALIIVCVLLLILCLLLPTIFWLLGIRIHGIA